MRGNQAVSTFPSMAFHDPAAASIRTLAASPRLVEASTAPLTHKQVAKAPKRRKLTARSQKRVLAALNATKADGDAFLISGRRTSTIYRVDRFTAKTKWRLRGDGVKPNTNDSRTGATGISSSSIAMNRAAWADCSLMMSAPTARPNSTLPSA